MPLKRAVELNNLSVVNFLLESGVVPQEEDYLLHIAVAAAKNEEDRMRLQEFFIKYANYKQFIEVNNA